MEEIIIKYLKKDNELTIVKNIVFVNKGYFPKISLIFGVSEIEFKNIFYKFYEFNNYIVVDLYREKFSESLSDLKDNYHPEHFKEILNTVLSEVVKLKREYVTSQNYEKAANYRDIEREIENQIMWDSGKTPSKIIGLTKSI